MTTKHSVLTSDTCRIIRERDFPALVSVVPDLLAALRNEHATGTLVLELNQGGVRAIRFREESRLSPPAHNSLDKHPSP